MARECMRNLRARFDALGLTCRVNGYRYDVMLGNEQVNKEPLNRDSILIWLDGAEFTKRAEAARRSQSTNALKFLEEAFGFTKKEHGE